MSWRALTVGELVDAGLADIQTGPFGTQLKASAYTSEGTPVINVRNIGYGGLRTEKLEFVAGVTAERLATHLLVPQDIVFGRKGAVDRHLYVTAGQDHWMQGSDCIRLRFMTDEVIPRFISYGFLAASHQKWMLTQSGNKATMASLNHDIIRRISLRLPAPSVQTATVDVLSAYDDLIENNRKRIVLLEESARLLYREWFVRLRFPGYEHARITNGVPEGWERVPTPNAIEINPSVRLSDAAEHWSVEMADLLPGSMLIQQATRRDGRSGSKFMNGDTLFARITPCLENGKTAFVAFLEDGEVARGSTEFIVLRSRRLTPEFVYLLARTYDFRENAIKSMIGSSGRQRVQESCFQKYPVFVPSATILSVFTETVRLLFQQVKTLHAQNQKLRAARDLLLPRLINGEIVV
ncbi:MAG TPA: restriction endonuclease subunit S [Armatimonadota bacterium]|jgi:type I restriction enzyme S subunit